MIDFQLMHHRAAFRLEAALQPSSRVTGIFGPSGSGKSTLLGLLAGMLKPEAGYFSIDGEYLFNIEKGIYLPPHQRRIGMMFQESRLFPHLSVEGNLRYGYQLLKPVERRFSVAEVVNLLELEEFLQRQPHQLSGGQKQRVALGRTLLASPRLLLFDEPLAALDIRLKSQILPFLQRVKDEIDIPMLYVSHAIDEILHLTSSIAVFDDGRVVGYGDFHQVMRDEKVLHLANSLGVENVLRGKLLTQDAEAGYSIMQLDDQLLHVPYCAAELHLPMTVSVAASNIAIALQRLEGVSIQNQLHGRISAIQKVDHRMLIEVMIGDHALMAEISEKAMNDLTLHPGDEVYCLIKTQSLKVYST